MGTNQQMSVSDLNSATTAPHKDSRAHFQNYTIGPRHQAEASQLCVKLQGTHTVPNSYLGAYYTLVHPDLIHPALAL